MFLSSTLQGYLLILVCAIYSICSLRPNGVFLLLSINFTVVLYLVSLPYGVHSALAYLKNLLGDPFCICLILYSLLIIFLSLVQSLSLAPLLNLRLNALEPSLFNLLLSLIVILIFLCIALGIREDQIDALHAASSRSMLAPLLLYWSFSSVVASSLTLLLNLRSESSALRPTEFLFMICSILLLSTSSYINRTRMKRVQSLCGLFNLVLLVLSAIVFICFHGFGTLVVFAMSLVSSGLRLFSLETRNSSRFFRSAITPVLFFSFILLVYLLRVPFTLFTLKYLSIALDPWTSSRGQYLLDFAKYASDYGIALIGSTSNQIDLPLSHDSFADLAIRQGLLPSFVLLNCFIVVFLRLTRLKLLSSGLVSVADYLGYCLMLIYLFFQPALLSDAYSFVMCICYICFVYFTRCRVGVAPNFVDRVDSNVA